MDLTDMDYIRAAIANAVAEGMTPADIYQCAEHASTAQDFDTAVNLLAQTMDQNLADQVAAQVFSTSPMRG